MLEDKFLESKIENLINQNVVVFTDDEIIKGVLLDKETGEERLGEVLCKIWGKNFAWFGEGIYIQCEDTITFRDFEEIDNIWSLERKMDYKKLE
ncbi:hypothetical protein [Bacillus paranthracis]|uniref:hypothetical protein n=1 Tax=Bacillus paranthracis TaxID=2026186 RepID=UPI000942FFC2|nr:hypothetical protein [bacterium]MBR2833039.1 hypothetical protein [Bacilli bacterium]MBR3209311.1 hypothetical protein [Bacilli bacterium]